MTISETANNLSEKTALVRLRAQDLADTIRGLEHYIKADPNCHHDVFRFCITTDIVALYFENAQRLADSLEHVLRLYQHEIDKIRTRDDGH